MTSKLDQEGYSLIEVMTVLSIVMILTVLAVPSFNRLKAHQRLNSAAAALLGDIRGARELAIKEGWQYGILYNSTTQYQVIKAKNQPTFAQAVAAGTSPPYTVVSTRAFGSSLMGYWGITMAITVSNMNMPVFQRSGAVSSWNSSTNNYTTTAPATITLNNSYSEGRTVSVGIMGYSRIQCVGTC